MQAISTGEHTSGLFASLPTDESGPAIAKLNALLAECRKQNASDVHISAGIRPYFRVNSEVKPQPGEPVSVTEVEAMAYGLMTPRQKQVFEEKRNLDLAFHSEDRTRYRVNVYLQRGTVAMAIRRLDDDFRTVDQLNLPPQLSELGNFPHGLVLVTGPTGSGKSTTLATILHEINLSRAVHIITIEDPIEYIHRNHMALVHQRELHADVTSFAAALKAALREDPDVILVGEMRDFETIHAAIIAAETGHLVFSTLHTGDCVGAVSRALSVFPAEEQLSVREQLSRSLRAVIAQRLLRRADGKGRVPVVEVMRVNPAIANLIRVGEFRQIYSILQTGGGDGILLWEQSLAVLCHAGLIAREEASMWARDPGVFDSRLRALQAQGRR